ncbi:dTDP-glucose 4,6-dehydratase [uncultured Algimonas sp.]|uniref:dTDP-glucose 4,6-dehydratase n=1 Tax=uncultured Algimonas sp. TaxID=1547920 RepID=UPI002631C882|nr:dTDP-glucose 4,6-dehydratase [uncultured Algimonas sp.]
MKILVTGGAGFIGSAVIREAVARGHSVVNVDKLTYAANLDSLRSVADEDGYIFERMDVCDTQAVAALMQRTRPDAVMHLAAESHVDRSIDGPGDFIQTNIVGTFSMLQAARSHWAGLEPDAKALFRFHHVSTDEVYGDLSSHDPAFSETTPYDPSSPYSASKAASDHLVRAWGRTFGLPVVLTNCSNNYGPYQFPEKLIPVAILKMLQEEPIPVYGDGSNVRDWLHVEDHVDALLTVLEQGRLGETYNIGGDNERTNLELVQALCSLMDRHSPTGRTDHASLIAFVDDRPGHDRRYAVDASRIRDELDWTPSADWMSRLEDTVLWYLQNEDWWRPLVEAKAIGQRLGRKA